MGAPVPTQRSLGSAQLQQLTAAPEFTGLTGWLNTPDCRPLTLESLRQR
jgi:hypothetical protein